MIVLEKASKMPLYVQIYSQVKNEILNGTLKENNILSGSRSLAKLLGVSRNTVDAAYGQLLAEGYISSQKGIGYTVSRVPKLVRTPMSPTERSSAVSTSSEGVGKTTILYDLTNSSHTRDLFPKNLWKKYTLECLDRLDNAEKLSSLQDKQGELYLRGHLLAYLERIRGIRCDEHQIVITCGLQQSLDSICTMLPKERSMILVEEPGFNKAVAVFVNKGADVRGVPVDAQGLVVSNLPAGETIGALYCTPSHQFPTGATLPIGRRYELLAWAQKNNAYIIEDDFDSELRYYAKPIPSLQSIDTDGRVMYLGTFSKALSPSIRMGYMILPPRLMDVYRDTFAAYNSTVPVLNQYVIGRLLETGQYDRHIRKMNHTFRKRMDLFVSEFSHFGDTVHIIGNGTGQYFLLKFSAQTDQTRLIESALAYGVKVYSTMQFWQDKAECPPNTLFLGLSKIRLEDIPDCVSRLKTAWAEWL